MTSKWPPSRYIIMLTLASFLPTRSVETQTSGPNCGIPPIAALASVADPEPQQPIWCVGGLGQQISTRQVDAFGGWTDAFNNNGQIGSFRDGDLGYRVFDNLEGAG